MTIFCTLDHKKCHLNNYRSDIKMTCDTIYNICKLYHKECHYDICHSDIK